MVDQAGTDNIMKPWIFVDVEANGTSPVNGTMTEFGAVHYDTREFIHVNLWSSRPHPENPAIPIPVTQLQTPTDAAHILANWLDDICDGQPVFISDNPAYDWMWIAAMFDEAGHPNPFGHSARRIGDFWAGMNLKWSNTQSWKRFRKTTHDHNPVHDAMGNVEAFEHILELAKEEHERTLSP